MILAVDVPIFVSAFIITQKNHSDAHSFYVDLMAGKHHVVVSNSVVVEVICAIGRRLKEMKFPKEYALRYWKSLLQSPYIVRKRIDNRLANDAGWIGWSHGLKGMDALAAAPAFYFNIPLLTEDKDFKSIKEVVTILSLKDVVTAS